MRQHTRLSLTLRVYNVEEPGREPSVNFHMHIITNAASTFSDELQVESLFNGHQQVLVFLAYAGKYISSGFVNRWTGVIRFLLIL